MTTATHHTRKTVTTALALLAVLAIIVLFVQNASATPSYGDMPPVAPTWNFEVAEDGTRFVFDDAPLFDDGMPAYGNSFVTQGFIYEAGTLGSNDGVVIDAGGNAAPEFPHRVIGEWTCYGTFIGDGAHETTDPWVVTTQIFEFDDGSSFVSTGTELPEQAGTVVRAITGGTGDYATVRGELEQTTHGHNSTDGVNADFTAHLFTGS